MEWKLGQNLGEGNQSGRVLEMGVWLEVDPPLAIALALAFVFSPKSVYCSVFSE